jgi:hypothetical protein
MMLFIETVASDGVHVIVWFVQLGTTCTTGAMCHCAALTIFAATSTYEHFVRLIRENKLDAVDLIKAYPVCNNSQNSSRKE